MSFKLTKEETTRREELTTSLLDLAAEIATSLKTYNEVLNNAADFCENVKDRFQEEFDNKSERWQESDAGSEVAELIEKWGQPDLEEIEIDLTHGEALEELPYEVSS